MNTKPHRCRALPMPPAHRHELRPSADLSSFPISTTSLLPESLHLRLFFCSLPFPGGSFSPSSFLLSLFLTFCLLDFLLFFLSLSLSLFLCLIPRVRLLTGPFEGGFFKTRTATPEWGEWQARKPCFPAVHNTAGSCNCVI